MNYKQAAIALACPSQLKFASVPPPPPPPPRSPPIPAPPGGPHNPPATRRPTTPLRPRNHPSPNHTPEPHPPSPLSLARSPPPAHPTPPPPPSSHPATKPPQTSRPRPPPSPPSGGMTFGHDGKLYFTVGERLFNEKDEPVLPIAQNVQDKRGKIYRINPDGSIPKDNPDFGPGAVSGLYAIGIRAAQGITYNAVTNKYGSANMVQFRGRDKYFNTTGQLWVACQNLG